MGGHLLDELLTHDPESLGVLIRLEMNRRLYREKDNNQEDPRSSLEVVKDSGVDTASLKRLSASIAKAEARTLLAKWGDQRTAEIIIKAAEALDQRVGQEAEIDKVYLGKLRGLILNAMIEELSTRLAEKEREKLQMASSKIEEKRTSQTKDALVGCRSHCD
jgi:ribose 1,5-bisphosphokinase PhnN